MSATHNGRFLFRGVVVTLSAAICLLWGAATVLRIMPPKNASFDFIQEWASTRNHFADQPIYASLNETIPKYLGRQWRAQTVDVNAHPPASVFILLPLAPLEYRTAHAAWNGISLIAMLVSLGLLIGRFGLGLPAWTFFPILALILTSNSFTQQMIQGQLNLLLLLLFTLAWIMHRGNRSFQSGLWMGLAAAVKLFPAFMGLYYLMRRDWRAVAGMAVSFTLLNGLAAGVLGVQTYRDYFGRVVPEVRDGFLDFWPNASISGFWSKLLDAPNGHVIPVAYFPALAAALTWLSVLAVTGLAAWKCWRARTEAERDVAFAVCMVAMMLVSPITWDHYFMLLVLAWAILWQQLPRRASWRIALLASIIVLGTMRPRWLWDAVIPGPGELVYFSNAEPSVALPVHVLTVISYQFYMLVALFLFAWFSSPPGDEETLRAAPRGDVLAV